jgi:hypothetical protein
MHDFAYESWSWLEPYPIVCQKIQPNYIHYSNWVHQSCLPAPDDHWMINRCRASSSTAKLHTEDKNNPSNKLKSIIQHRMNTSRAYNLSQGHTIFSTQPPALTQGFKCPASDPTAILSCTWYHALHALRPRVNNFVFTVRNFVCLTKIWLLYFWIWNSNI